MHLLDFTAPNVDQLRDEVRAGDVHLADQLGVYALTAHHQTGNKAQPVLRVPLCKKGNFIKFQASVMMSIITAWFSFAHGGSFAVGHGPINNIASDGDGPRRVAMCSLVDTTLTVLAATGNRCAAALLFLMHLPLFDGRVMGVKTAVVGGICGWVIRLTFDPKHVLKRWHTQIKSWTVQMTIFGVVITADLIIETLIDVAGCTSTELSPLFDPKDKMRVSSCIKLFKMIWQLRSARLSEWPSKWRSTPQRHAEQTALQLLGFIVQRLQLCYFDNTITVSTHLQCMAELMLMTFLIYSAVFEKVITSGK